MCVHTPYRPASNPAPVMKTLNQRFAELSYVPMTFSDGRTDFTMYVNPRSAEGVKRAYNDLRSWHPKADITDASLLAITQVSRAAFSLRDLARGRGLLMEDRNIPDSLDLDEKSFDAVYARCKENGYFGS